MTKKSNFPIFHTSLSKKMKARKKLQDPKRKLIPISNPEAYLKIYANYRVNENGKVSRLITLSQKLIK
ncbi:hypothetical protein E5351_02980 [Lactobacillus intestinalis]|uniref:Uncharacterized protein n=1 Tax=Lactobacillus intestinalis TaxID=151781 RepID=A0A4S2BQ80_9LACO|nr:hypothetical protein E5351_02980 [Lactobacillus intestinalis]